MSIGFNTMRRHNHFTLIELLVVVAIIAILAALLLPAMSSARARAHLAACATNEKQVALAIAMYMDEADGYGPISEVNSSGNPRTYYPIQLASYLGGPKASDLSENFNLATFGPKQIALLQCPSTYDRWNIWGPTSYGPNRYITTITPAYAAASVGIAWWQFQPVAGAMRLESSKFADSADSALIWGESVSSNQLIPSWNTVRLYTFIHADRRNFALLDGHVESSRWNGPTYILFEQNDHRLKTGRNNNQGAGEP